MEAVPRFLGVAAYSPAHCETLSDLPEADRSQLRALRGQRLVRSWAMWETVESAWFRDGPLILEFQDRRLEIAAFKLHICLSWGAIDVQKEVVWYEGSSFHLAWRESALDPLNALRDPIDEVLAVEYRGGLNGLAFRAGDAYAEVFNALDELGLADTPEDDPEVSRVPI
jgi:hypothetical protein